MIVDSYGDMKTRQNFNSDFSAAETNLLTLAGILRCTLILAQRWRTVRNNRWRFDILSSTFASLGKPPKIGWSLTDTKTILYLIIFNL